jgi:hypothetical protein
MKWEVSIMELEENGALFKVMRRIPHLGVVETNVFPSKKKALEHFTHWLEYMHYF